MKRAMLMTTQAKPKPKHASTASFSVFRICNCHTQRSGITTIMRSVAMFDKIRHLISDT